ncbi:MAG: cation transporter [Methanobacteriota archaeon]|nr:MAG: cation transporter [Euryarchaeota archaeon]
MGLTDDKKAVAGLSVLSNASLVTLKLVVGLLTGSVGVLSEALHSSTDLLAAAIARFSVGRSALPADEDHRYGHGKFENLSGLIEGSLIFVAAGAILFEAGRRIMQTSEVDYAPVGMGVMAVSAVVNTLVSRKLYAVAKETDSLALEADAYHLKADVWTSVGVFVALGVITVTGWHIVDPIVAIFIAAVIARAAGSITKRSVDGLLDRSLPRDEMRAIEIVMKRHMSRFVDYHKLRARKTGAYRELDLHVILPRTLNVQESHALVEALEVEIRLALPRSTIVVHVEPCNGDCEACRLPPERRNSSCRQAKE